MVTKEEDNKETTNKLDWKVKTVDGKVSALEKEKKVKYEIIKNLNVGFIEKVSNLNANVNTLEAVNKEGLRKEKKAIQNHRQQTDKATNKDCNGNFVNNVKRERERGFYLNGHLMSNNLQLTIYIRSAFWFVTNCFHLVVSAYRVWHFLQVFLFLLLLQHIFPYFLCCNMHYSMETSFKYFHF